MESKEGRTVKQKVILNLHNPDNLSQFIQEFAEVTLDRDMNKIDAAEELKAIQENFRDFSARYNANPRNVHPDLNEAELRSLEHVNPDTNFDEEDFTSITNTRSRQGKSSGRRKPSQGSQSGFRLE